MLINNPSIKFDVVLDSAQELIIVMHVKSGKKHVLVPMSLSLAEHVQAELASMRGFALDKKEALANHLLLNGSVSGGF